jgi:transcriptional regulator with XRE-family HTH domain
MTEQAAPTLGRRLREIRVWRGMSLRATAELAGLSAGYLSRVERGERAIDRRSVVEALAQALRVSPSELTGQPYRLAEPADLEVRATSTELEVVLAEPPFEPPARSAERGWPALAATLAQLNTVHRPAADYVSQGRLLPELLTNLRAALVTEPGHRRDVLLGLLDAYHAAEELTKSVGVPGLPQLAVLHAQRVAEELDEPAALGLAAWLRAIALGSAGRERVLDLCRRTIDDLAGVADPAAQQMTGALHLTSALAHAAVRRPDDAAAHLVEARRIAERVPADAPDFGLVYFSPDNVGIWRVSIAVELGESGKAAEIASTVRPDAVPSQARRAMFWADLGRGLAAERRTRDAAVSAFRQAEEISPHTVRNNVLVREAVGDLLRRVPRDRNARELRGLAYRMGFAA